MDFYHLHHHNNHHHHCRRLCPCSCHFLMGSKEEESCLEFQHDWENFLVSGAQILSNLIINSEYMTRLKRSQRKAAQNRTTTLSIIRQYSTFWESEKKCEVNILMEVLDKAANSSGHETWQECVCTWCAESLHFCKVNF